MTTPDNVNPFRAEEGPEKILSREEIINKLREYCEEFDIEREVSDAGGVYLMEVISKADPNLRYAYQRNGTTDGRVLPVSSLSVTIRIEYLDWSQYPETLADYNSVTKVWTKNG